MRIPMSLMEELVAAMKQLHIRTSEGVSELFHVPLGTAKEVTLTTAKVGSVAGAGGGITLYFVGEHRHPTNGTVLLSYLRGSDGRDYIYDHRTGRTSAA